MQEVVNIIPCIAKADSFTSEELKDYKQTIRHQLKQNKICSFNFSDSALNQRMPFSLIGSDTKVQSNDGGSFRGRKYPWGVVNIEDEVYIHLLYFFLNSPFTDSGTLRFPGCLQGALHSWSRGAEAANSLFSLRTLQSKENSS